MYLLGSHVGMSGKEMMLGSVKEALSYGANTFMVYTGAPQNTRRKKLEELRIEEARQCMEENGIQNFIVHAPYIINLANTVKPETFEIAVEFLGIELERTAAMGAGILVLHPGAHVGAGEEAGIARIIEGLDQVMSKDMPVHIALETMAGKGSEIGRTFEELKAVYDGVRYPEHLRVCLDTCDEVLGLDQIAAIHINDSKNPLGAHKDRHENVGKGHIGFETLLGFVSDERFKNVPKILETPWIKENPEDKKSTAPYKEEIARFQQASSTAPI